LDPPLITRHLPFSLTHVQVLIWGTTVAGAYPYASNGTISTIERSSLCGAPATESGFMDLGATITAEVRAREPTAWDFPFISDQRFLFRAFF
jgi:hypothetical protein